VIAFSPDGKILAIGRSDIKLWDVKQKQTMKKFSDISSISAIAFSTDGKVLVGGSEYYKKIVVWNIDS